MVCQGVLRGRGVSGGMGRAKHQGVWSGVKWQGVWIPYCGGEEMRKGIRRGHGASGDAEEAWRVRGCGRCLTRQRVWEGHGVSGGVEGS